MKTFLTLFPNLHMSLPSTCPPQKKKNEGPVCLVRTADDVYSFFSPPSHIPQWTHVLLNFRVKDREGEESLVFICSPSSTLIKEICGYTGTNMLFFYSIKEPIVPSLTGSCIIFLSSCLCVLVLTNFGSPFSFSEETETDSSLHNLTQTCLTHRVSVL